MMVSLTLKVSLSMMVAQSLGSVKVSVQPENDWLEAIAASRSQTNVFGTRPTGSIPGSNIAQQTCWV